MHSFNSSDMFSHPQSSPFYLRGHHDIDKNGAYVADLGELLQFAGNGFQSFHLLDSADLARMSSMYNGIKTSNVSVVSSNLQFGGLPNNFGSAETLSSGVAVEVGEFMLHKDGATASGSDGGGGAVGNWQFQDWEGFGVVADHSHQTEASIDNDLHGVHHSQATFRNQKELLKLAQNRAAARKSRMRKKAYVQQLESSQQRLTQLDQALGKARQQGILVASGFSGDQRLSIGGSGVAFDTDHTRWVEEHERLVDDLRSALNSDVGDTQLHHLVDAAVSHYDELFRIKSAAAKSDMFHMLSGIWRTPAERCLMWLGGFRSSDLLKVLEKQIQPLTEQQLVGICNLQQSSQQAEDALSQGMEALQQSLVDTMSSSSVAPHSAAVDYMSQMAVAMSKITIIENFLNQADLLRLHTLQQLQRILTTRQVARALVAINDYKSRLRALSSLWLACPKE